MNNNDKPITICADLSDEKFIEYIKQELKSRSLNTIKYFMGVKTYPDQKC